MASLLLADDQRDFIIHGVREDFRNDGRSCKDYRKFELSTDLITNANASAKIKLVISYTHSPLMSTAIICNDVL